MASQQNRKYLITINNPADKGYSHETIQQILFALKASYYCIADEIGANGTYHTHIFMYRESPYRFETIQRKFPGAHIDSCLGSCQENRDYVAKEGKWANDKKAETSVPGSFVESGPIPEDRSKSQHASAELIASLDAGKSISEIIRDNPAFVFRATDIGALRETLLADRYMSEQREIEVHYLYGPSGSGKTRHIFETYPATDICRITDYGTQNGVKFDAYHGQDVLVFEEFHSQIPIASMLNYLDRYPLYLPARYADRVACFTKVYITSNLPLEKQYRAIQFDSPSTWNAFLRRITTVVEYLSDGTTLEHRVSGYRLEESV